MVLLQIGHPSGVREKHFSVASPKGHYKKSFFEDVEKCEFEEVTKPLWLLVECGVGRAKT